MIQTSPIHDVLDKDGLLASDPQKLNGPPHELEATARSHLAPGICDCRPEVPLGLTTILFAGSSFPQMWNFPPLLENHVVANQMGSVGSARQNGGERSKHIEKNEVPTAKEELRPADLVSARIAARKKDRAMEVAFTVLCSFEACDSRDRSVRRQVILSAKATIRKPAVAAQRSTRQ